MSYANYLHRTPSTAGNRRTFTISTWFKKSVPSGQGWLLTVDTFPSGNMFQYQLDTQGNIGVQQYSGGTNQNSVTTNNLQRDLSAWYHVVLRIDTTQATASDRVRIYINGEEASYSSTTYPSQNFEYAVNNTVEHQINSRLDATSTNGQSTYFAHYHLCDGYSYAPTEFGETDSTSGIWKPKTSPSVSYGTNGFFLKFQDTSNFGDDSSGNTNDLTTVGTITQAEDNPSNNFATLNVLASTNSANEFQYGNTEHYTTNNWTGAVTTLGAFSGKWYAEGKITDVDNFSIGIAELGGDTVANMNTLNSGYVGKYSDAWGYYGNVSITQKMHNNSATTYGSAFAVNDIAMIAMDLDNGKFFIGKNGTWFDSSDPANGTSPAFSFTVSGVYGFMSGLETGRVQWNFGNGYFGTSSVASSNSDSAGLGLFEYSVPSGFYSLCTKNIKNYG